MTRHSQPHKPSSSIFAPLTSPPFQESDVYDAASYENSSDTSALQQPPLSLSMSPPPPYQPHDSSFYHAPHIPSYSGQQYNTQYYLPHPRPDIQQLPQTPWASTSTLDVGWPQARGNWTQEQGWQSHANVVAKPGRSGNYVCPIARGMNQGAALCDRVAARLNDALSRADGGENNEAELESMTRGLDLQDGGYSSDPSDGTTVRGRKIAKERNRSNHILNFKKTWLYQNARLPPGMVPFNVYLPTWTLICRAAQASMEVYKRPSKTQRDHYTDADPKRGTKATIIKSQPVDDRKLVIVAIRGSQMNIVDWTVNFAVSPTEPIGFLDDEGNACHAGFLEVARAMVGSIAAQLRSLVEDDPSWITSSLIFTGHSAGGAVASLLYAHMLATTVESELTLLAGIFKRIHCITFGVPPISLLPLQVPIGHSDRKNQFLSFVNEGDLVVRADKPYIRSLIKLLAEPAPESHYRPHVHEKSSRLRLRNNGPTASASAQPRWPVPDATLSNAGRLVLLREKPNSRSRKTEAMQLTDGQLRDVIFGDVSMHSMAKYKERLDGLAFAAVSGTDAG